MPKYNLLTTRQKTLEEAYKTADYLGWERPVLREALHTATNEFLFLITDEAVEENCPEDAEIDAIPLIWIPELCIAFRSSRKRTHKPQAHRPRQGDEHAS
jgi:hypothetical protein